MPDPISTHGEADAKEQNPRNRSTLPDCWKKKLIKVKLGFRNEDIKGEFGSKTIYRQIWK